MFEKVNMCHPDKIADRIAGAIVDLAYKKEKNPKIAVEILIGHNDCNIITESSVVFEIYEIERIINRLAGNLKINLNQNTQDTYLAKNQEQEIRCGDNGIFKGMPLTKEEIELSLIAKDLYNLYGSDGKYILDKDRLIICQSNANYDSIVAFVENETRFKNAIINPLGYWTGGINVDSGATNRKLGSDMGHSVTGGGLHGKDLSKADVSINIYAFLKAQETGQPVELCCAIGDDTVDGKPYSEIVEIARNYISNLGGFEKFAEWGLLNLGE